MARFASLLLTPVASAICSQAVNNMFTDLKTALVTWALCGPATVALAASSNVSQLYYERLEALGLLGSHFGSVGVPASFDYIVVGGGKPLQASKLGRAWIDTVV